MEHISEILKRSQTPINTSKANTDTSSSTEEQPSPPDCPVCRGAGFVYADVPVGHPGFGKAVPCRCAGAVKDKERQSRIERYSNLGALTKLAFDNLVPQGRSGNPASQDKFQRAYAAAKAFAAEPKGWLVLVGPSGCGKTHLAAAIANERVKLGAPVFFQSVPDLLHHLRSAYSPESAMTYDELFERVRNAPLLILDDLGVQASSSWAREKLDQLLTYRFTSELPTVITTSIPPQEMEDRIRSRLIDARVSQVFVIEEQATPLLEYGWGPAFEREKDMTFQNFDPHRANLPRELRENLEAAYREAFEFARAPADWLILLGVNGCGKTHLAAAIANYRYQARQPALFIVVPDFLDHLRSTFSPESKISYDQLFEKVKTTPLLILDDFGEQSTTPWAQEKLYQVINYRYNARLATVITSSCSLDEIESRFASRLADPKISTPFSILAPDYRTDATSHRRKMTRRGRKESGD